MEDIIVKAKKKVEVKTFLWENPGKYPRLSPERFRIVSGKTQINIRGDESPSFYVEIESKDALGETTWIQLNEVGIRQKEKWCWVHSLLSVLLDKDGEEVD